MRSSDFGLEHVELGLDAEVEHVAELGGLVELLLQDRTRAVRERLAAAEAEVGGHPYEALVPRACTRSVDEVGNRDTLVFVRRHLPEVTHAARRVPLGTGEQVGKMVDRDDLRLRSRP